MKISHLVHVACLLATAAAAPVQETRPAPSGFEGASTNVSADLEASLAELTALREQLVAEKLPLARSLRERESQLVDTRLEYQQTTRLLDSRTLDLTNLRSEIKLRQDEVNYLATLLADYRSNFESRLHIAESQRYAATLAAARLATENSNLSEAEIFASQVAVIDLSLQRHTDALGGARFEGTAVDASGIVQRGTFALVGPSALFRSADGSKVGTAEERLGSLEPTIIEFSDPLDIAAATMAVVGSGEQFPFDPTLGNAHKVESTNESLIEHIKKGGPVMYPIFAMAGAALLVALFKWVQLTFQRKPTRTSIAALLAAVAKRDQPGAISAAKAVAGPAGAMLEAGAEHLHEPRELIEEIMYERMLVTKLRVQRLLPFVAISASSAPLLGLLGTVTGIMNTFKLITVFGTGDVKTLSSGISEALITTEYGLIVAIPSLLLHALLSRKARAITDEMDKCAVAFMNEVGKAGAQPLERVA